MKTFDEIYNELQSDNYLEFNNAWKEAKKSSEKANKYTLIICLIIDFFAIIMFMALGGISLISLISLKSLLIALSTVLFMNVMIAVVMYAAYTGEESRKYKNKYKNIVIKKIMDNFYDNLEYFPEGTMPEYIYRNLGYEYYDNYRSEDYFEAKIDNKYSIQMAEILTQKEKSYSDLDGDDVTVEITKFHGLFVKVVMEKSINGEIKIMEDGKFSQGKKLKMDSSEFEEFFDVQASDRIVAMQLLTSDVMEELTEFVYNIKMQFDIILRGNELYLRFHSGNMFEPGSLKNGTLDKKSLEKNFNILKFTYNLSNRLISVVNDAQI